MSLAGDYPEALAEIPEAAAVAQRLKATKGFDPLDPALMHATIRGYLKCRTKMRMWSTILSFPLFLVILGLMVSIGGSNPGTLVGGLTLTVIGLALSWFPLRTVIRTYKTYVKDMLPVVHGYEDVLRAAQPNGLSGTEAVNRWRRSKGLM